MTNTLCAVNPMNSGLIPKLKLFSVVILNTINPYSYQLRDFKQQMQMEKNRFEHA